MNAITLPDASMIVSDDAARPAPDGERDAVPKRQLARGHATLLGFDRSLTRLLRLDRFRQKPPAERTRSSAPGPLSPRSRGRNNRID